MPGIISRRPTPRVLLIGFVAGALATATFHQVAVLILANAGLIQATPYSLRPVPPFAVPTILNAMFWGGLWGVLFALLEDRWPRGWSRLASGFVFGLAGPLLVTWFVVSPLRGQPVAAGFDPSRMLAGVLILGAFGIGLGLIYDVLSRRSR